MEKHSVSRLSYLFAHLHLLSSDSFSSTLLSSNLSLLSASSLLCFSSVHIVGGLTSNLPSIITYMMNDITFTKVKVWQTQRFFQHSDAHQRFCCCSFNSSAIATALASSFPEKKLQHETLADRHEMRLQSNDKNDFEIPLPPSSLCCCSASHCSPISTPSDMPS